MAAKPRARARFRTGPAGLGVDYAGNPVIDPTENVLALVAAETKRQDDLRELTTKHLEEMSSLRAVHQDALRKLESDRLDAIRGVDQANVNTAADRTLAAVQTLAATTASNADNLRTAWDHTVQAIIERVAALEKSSYKGEGKGSGISASWGVLLGIVTLIVMLIGIGSVVYMANRPPQVVYTQPAK